MMVVHYHHASFRGVSPMTTRTLSLFHMLCVKLSQEFTMKENINGCCREVLQHHRSQQWFWMQTSSQNPQKKTKRNCWDLVCFKKVKQNPLIFRSYDNSKKNIFCAAAAAFWSPFFCGALRRISVVSRHSYSGFFCRWYNLVRYRCRASKRKRKHDTGLVDWDFNGGQNKVLPIIESSAAVCPYFVTYIFIWIINPLHKRV